MNSKKIISAAVLTSVFLAGLVAGQVSPGSSRVAQFDNPAVKVWKSTVLPNSPLPMHRHEHPRVIIALTGGTMRIAEDNGSSEVHQWETGKAYWLPANRPGALHTDANSGDKPIEVMVVELLNEH